MCRTIGEGDIRKIKALIAEGADVNGKEGLEGETPLHVAVIWDRKDVAQLLIANGADVNAKSDAPDPELSMRSSTTQTALQMAAFEGYRDMAELLLAKGADVNAKAENGNTALHYAVFAGHKAIVELLLANEAKLNVEGRDELTPLQVAVWQSHEEIARLLVTDDTEVTIHLAAFIGDLPRLKVLIEAGEAVDANDRDGMRPLHHAATGGNKDAVQFLIAKGADVNAKVPEILSDVEKELGDELQSESPKDPRAARGSEVGFAPLHFAAIDGYLKVAELLIDNGAKVDAKGPYHLYGSGDEGPPDNTPLFFAVCNGHSEVVELLASRGANVNTRGSPLSGQSPYWAIGPAQYPPGPALIWAINRGHIKTAEVLIAHGADIHARGSLAGWGPLQMAAKTGNAEAAKLLIAKGADVNATNKSGDTALHEAIAWGHHKDVVNVLIDAGAKINVQNRDGWTPLHEATASASARSGRPCAKGHCRNPDKQRGQSQRIKQGRRYSAAPRRAGGRPRPD
ncbi:MAG: ankyrin repeat domain-containing protein [Planctomycetota bacterium]